MDVKVGDEIIVDGLHAGDAGREGEILEVLMTGGVLHYRVRWDDTGHAAIFYPGSNAHAVRLGAS